MKKIRKALAVILAAILALSLSVPVFANEEESVSWTWDETTKTLTVTGSGDLDGLDVSALQSEPSLELLEEAMPYGYGVHVLDAEHLVLGEGITGIGDYGFAYFMELKTVSLPSTLTRIGDAAFAGCFSLQELVIPDGVSYFGYAALMLNMSLQRLVLPDNAALSGTMISEMMIVDEIVIPENVGDIRLYAQYGSVENRSAEAVVMPYVFMPPQSRALFTAYYKGMYKGMLLGIDIDDEDALTAYLLQFINDEFGASYTAEELEDLLNADFDEAQAYGMICCQADSAQHTYCANNYLPHTLLGETEPHTDCFRYEGSYLNGAGETIVWALNKETGVLTVEGVGAIGPADSSERAWRARALEGLITRIELGVGITSINAQLANYSVGHPIALAVPSTVTYIDTAGFYDNVYTFEIDEGNETYFAEGGFLYRALDAWTITEYAGFGIEGARFSLIYYPPNAESWTPAAGTVEMRAYPYGAATVTIPDGIVKAELNGSSSIKTINIGKDLREASRYETWYNADELETVNVDPENPWIKSEDGFIYSKDGRRLLSWINPASGEYHVPETVETIDSNAFWWDESGVPDEKVDVYITNHNCPAEDWRVPFSASWARIEDVFVIHGYEGSAIQTYAVNHGIPFAVIEEKTVESISVLTPPEKTTYVVGAARLETKGLTLLVTFSDGTTAVRDAGFVCEGFDSSALGTKTITVSYEGKTAAFEITIRAPRSYVIHKEETIDVEFDAEEEVTITYLCEESGTYTLFSASLTNDYYPYVAEYDGNGRKIFETYYNGPNGNFVYEKTFEAGKTYTFGVRTGYGTAGHTKVTLAENHVHQYSEEIEVISSPTCMWTGWGYRVCDCGMGLQEQIPQTDHMDEDLDGVCDMCETRLTYQSYVLSGEVDEVLDFSEFGYDTVVYYTASSDEMTITADVDGEVVNHSKNWLKCYLEANETEELIQMIPGDVYRINLRYVGGQEKIRLVIHEHRWEIAEVLSPSTCLAPGLAKLVCAGCGGEKTDVLPIDENAHQRTKTVGRVEPTCGEAGYSGDLVCEDCGATVVPGETLEPTGEHNWEWKRDTEPTCGTPGVQHMECSVCHQRQNEGTPIDPTGDHDWQWKHDTEPTCGTPGVQHMECSVCHQRQNEGTPIDPTGDHTWGEWRTKTPATATQEGKKERVCAVCGKTQEDVIPATGEPEPPVVTPEEPAQSGNCPCGKTHTGFFGRIVIFFHTIFYFFKNLFSR